MKNSRTPTLSIVIVNFNNAPGLNTTLNKLAELDSDLLKKGIIEFIFVDGQSNDESLNLAIKSGIFSKIISEKDNGIYDAMNKGIFNCSGTYVYFLNTNDIINTKNFESVLDMISNRCFDLIVSDVDVYNSENQYIKQQSPRKIEKSDFLYSMPVCHQGVFFRRDHKLFYNDSFKVIADKELIFRYASGSILYTNLSIMNYVRDGYSTSNKKVWTKENLTFSFQHFGINRHTIKNFFSYLYHKM